MSLVDLAEQNNLPEHQFIDRETLDWICNNPVGSDQKKIVRFDPVEFYRYFPRKEWFHDYESINSIHGIRHLVRVAIFSEVLFKSRKWLFFNLKLINILTAAFFHDIARENDKNDNNHGKRSARWFRENIIEVEKAFNVRYNKNDVYCIYNAIAYHEVPYSQIEKNISAKYGRMIDIIKTADALDRFRMPKLKWRINCQYLKLIPSAELKYFAYKLVCLTEDGFLKGIDGFDGSLYSIAIDKIKKYE